MNKVAFTFYSFEGSWSTIIEYDGTAEDAMAEYELVMEERECYMAKRQKEQDKIRERYFKTDASKYIEEMKKWPPKFEVVVGGYLLEARTPADVFTQEFDEFIDEMMAKRVDGF